MLPKKNRLPHSFFDIDLKKSKTHHGDHLSLRVVFGRTITTRFSVVVSKKVEKKAVNRNRLRRKGYAALREFMLQIKQPMQAVLYFKSGASKLSVRNILEEIQKLEK